MIKNNLPPPPIHRRWGLQQIYEKGFSLPELLITITVLIVALGLVYSTHLLSQKSYREVETLTEITQNGRIIFERMTREIRQAKEIVTELSEDEPEETVGPAQGIIFEDGHREEPYYYIHYFKENTNLKQEIIVYYFSGDSSTYVPWDAAPPEGQTLEQAILENRIIGEYITGIKFWGSGVINIFITLEKNNKKINLRTKISGRNI